MRQPPLSLWKKKGQARPRRTKTPHQSSNSQQPPGMHACLPPGGGWESLGLPRLLWRAKEGASSRGTREGIILHPDGGCTGFKVQLHNSYYPHIADLSHQGAGVRLLLPPPHLLTKQTDLCHARVSDPLPHQLLLHCCLTLSLNCQLSGRALLEHIGSMGGVCFGRTPRIWL